MSGAPGLAALSICESMLLSMTDTGVIDDDEAKAILEDAATAHRNAAGALDGSGEDHRAARLRLAAGEVGDRGEVVPVESVAEAERDRAHQEPDPDRPV